MKNFLTSLGAFFCFSVVFYVVVLLFWGKFTHGVLKPNLGYYKGGYGHTFSRLNEAKKIGNVDILFLGSSHSYRGFDPRIFTEAGYTSFNLGSSSQTPKQTRVLLERYLKRLNPKVVLFEVYPEIFNIDGVESALDIISNDRNDFSSRIMGFKLNNIKVVNALIYAEMVSLIGLNRNFIENRQKGEDFYIPGGYVEKKLSYYKYVKRSINSKEWKYRSNQFSAFLDIVEMIEKNGAELVTIFAPITPLQYASYANNDEIDSLFRAHTRYYNFNNLLSLDDSLHFYDSHHLNKIGVKLFNHKLLEFIDSLQTLTTD